MLFAAAVLLSAGCPTTENPGAAQDADFAVPYGYMARLEQVHDGRMIGFGPFVGYYFRPANPDDLRESNFVCFNENTFYSSDMADGAKLYEGTAVMATLPDANVSIPTGDRINPIFFSDAPQPWLETRPEPRDEFRHFHSCYNGAGPVRTGYWIRHVAVADFTYDMGGRVGEDSPLHHRVQRGPDRDFAEIIEFDRGPDKERS